MPCGARLSRGRGPVVPNRATGLCLDLAGGVFSHIVAAGLDPDGVVHDAVHDRVGVNPRTEALVPILLGVLGAAAEGAKQMAPNGNIQWPPSTLPPTSTSGPRRQ